MKNIIVEVTFIEEVLATCPGDKDIYSNYIASKAPDAMTRKEEIEMFGSDIIEERGKQLFPRLKDGTPFIWDYQWKGFFKEACYFCKNSDDGNESKKIRAYKKWIDGLVLVYPRMIPFRIPDGLCIDSCQRPLRASTPKGEIVSLANSETVPAGTTQRFVVQLLRADMLPAVLEWFSYGCKKGTGQWRSSGKGRFVSTILDEEGNVIASNTPIDTDALIAKFDDPRISTF